MSSPKHMFDVELAKEFGIEEAIILENIAFWTRKYIANDEHHYDGHYYMYNSRRAWLELFPYISENKIRRALKTLIDRGILKTGNYNTDKRNMTLWYALTKEGINLFSDLQKAYHAFVDSTNVIGESNQSTLVDLTNVIYTDNKHSTDNKHTDKKKEVDVFCFDGFLPTEKAAIEEWLTYKQEQKKSYTKTGLSALRNKLLKDKKKGIDICLAIEHSIVNNYSGIYSPSSFKSKEKTLKDQIREDLLNSSQTNYDSIYFEECV